MMHFTNMQTPLSKPGFRRALQRTSISPPGPKQMWLVVSERSWASSILGEKIWNPVSLRTETG